MSRAALMRPGGARTDPAALIVAGFASIAIGVWLGWWGGDWALATGAMWEGPSREHWLGTNRLGQDIFARSLAATARAFEIGLPVTAGAVALGVALGLTAGFFRAGWFDALVLWLAGVFDALPFYLLVIAVAFALGDHPLAVHAAMLAAFWTTTARLIRAEVASLIQCDFVAAARAGGSTNRRIILRHILPHTAPIVLVQAVIVFIAAVKAEIILAFLGLGRIDGISFGGMIAESSQEILAGQYMNLAAAGLGLFVLTASLSRLANRAQTALDPRSARNPDA